MASNKHPTTGIAFGVIGAHRLDPELVDRLMFGQQAVNTSYETAKKDYVEAQRHSFECEKKEDQHGADEEFDEEYAAERFADRFTCDEPIIEGVYEGVKYATVWIGGAPHFFIFESPKVGRFYPCSPCVPGAGDLHNEDPTDGIETYDVPTDWVA